jgi:Flp pilus assembly protein TadG
MTPTTAGKKGEKGASAVEFALVLPLLVIFVFGIIEFGLLLYNKQVITNASREGARAGIVSQTPRVTVAEMQTVVQNYAVPHLVTFTGGVVLPTTTVQNNTSGGNQCVSFSDNLTVTVTYPYTFLALSNLMNLLGPSTLGPSLTLTAQTVMRCE